MKKHVITISGNIASGKSEVSRMLADKLSYELYKASEEFRKQARINNMTLVEFNEYLKDKPEVDMYVDSCTRDYIKDKNNVVVDARLGFHFVKDAFDVYLKSDVNTAAARLFLAAKTRGEEEKYESVEIARLGIERREHAERLRYSKMYNVDIADMKNYSYVIDTTNVTSSEVVDKIIEQYNEWLKG